MSCIICSLLLSLLQITQAVGGKQLVIARRDITAFVFSFLGKPVIEDVKITATTFGGVPVRVYQSPTQTGNELAPGFVWVHGKLPQSIKAA